MLTVLMLHRISYDPMDEITSGMYIGCIVVEMEEEEPIRYIERLWDKFAKTDLSDSQFPAWLANASYAKECRFDDNDGNIPLQVYLR